MYSFSLSVILTVKGDKQMTKFYSLLYDSTFKYFLKESSHLKFFSDLIEKETGYSLMDYEFHDQELNTGNHKKDFRLNILLKKKII